MSTETLDPVEERGIAYLGGREGGISGLCGLRGHEIAAGEERGAVELVGCRWHHHRWIRSGETLALMANDRVRSQFEFFGGMRCGECSFEGV